MARTTKGRLYTRGSNYYLQYYVKGKEFRVALRNERGEAITSERLAQKAADKVLASILAKDEASRVRNVLSELQSVEEKAATAENNYTNSKAAIVNGWKLFMSCPHRPTDNVR